MMGSRQEKYYKIYRFIWDADARRVSIKPRRTDKRAHTEEFGLGNATIKLNTNYIDSEKITVPITGESNRAAILPNAPFGAGKWVQVASSPKKETAAVTGGNITYVSVAMEHHSAVASREVVTAGTGSIDIGLSERIMW